MRTMKPSSRTLYECLGHMVVSFRGAENERPCEGLIVGSVFI